jgi:hypothetical protein
VIVGPIVGLELEDVMNVVMGIFLAIIVIFGVGFAMNENDNSTLPECNNVSRIVPCISPLNGHVINYIGKVSNW